MGRSRIGNTSAALAGGTKLRAYEPITGMAITGNYSYVALGYNEACPPQYRFSLNDPQQKTWIGPTNGTEAAIYFLDTDGTNVYWSGADPLEQKNKGKNETFVFATRCSDDAQVRFWS